jgi:hypothetical protein
LTQIWTSEQSKEIENDATPRVTVFRVALKTAGKTIAKKSLLVLTKKVKGDAQW